MTDLEILADEFCKTWRTLKARHMDLTVYQAAIESLLSKHPKLTQTVNALLADSKRLPLFAKSLIRNMCQFWGRCFKDFPPLFLRQFGSN